jgi:hypothetical protein
MKAGSGVIFRDTPGQPERVHSCCERLTRSSQDRVHVGWVLRTATVGPGGNTQR